MQGHEHYREAERLLALCEEPTGSYPSEFGDGVTDWNRNNLMAAQIHATLAHAAAVVEASDRIGVAIDGGFRTRHLVLRPTRADDVDGPFPGSPWGRALYGDLHLDTKDH
jgi:hypothetical protein